MLEFLSPYPLAFLALAIPLLIHLWNRKQLVQIPFGSLENIIEDQKRPNFKLQFRDLFIFLLRATLILSLILLIFKPIIAEQLKPKKTKKTEVYLNPNLLPISDYEPIKNLLDSLESKDQNSEIKDYKIFELANGFHEFRHDSILRRPKNGFLSQDNTWALLKLIDDKSELNKNIIIFDCNQVSATGIKKPELNSNISHIYLPLKEPKQLSIISTLKSKEDSIIIHLIESSTEKNTPYRLSFGKDEKEIESILGDVQLNKEGVLTIPSKGFESSLEITGRKTETIRQINLIYAKDRFEDALFVHAALLSLKQLYNSKLKIKKVREKDWSNEPSEHSAYVLLGLKSDKIKPANNNGIILSDAFSKDFNQIKASLNSQSKLSNTGNSPILFSKQIEVYKGASDMELDSIVLQDSELSNALGYNLKKNIKEWKFYSRFHPEYCSIIEDGNIVELFNSIFLKSPIASNRQISDLRTLDPKQAKFKKTDSAKLSWINQTDENKILKTRNLFNLAWLFVLILFIIERCICEFYYGRDKISKKSS